MPPPIGGLGGWGAHLVSPPSRHFLGGSGLVWSGTCLFLSLQLDVNELVSQWGGIKAMALPCRQKQWQKELSEDQGEAALLPWDYYMKRGHQRNQQTDKQTDKQTHIATTRPTRPRGPSW